MLSFWIVTLLTLLGSTGSIGKSTLDVVERWPDRFGIYALVAGRNVELLARQIAQFRPQVAVVADETALEKLRKLLKEQGHLRLSWPPARRRESPPPRLQKPDS